MYMYMYHIHILSQRISSWAGCRSYTPLPSLQDGTRRRWGVGGGVNRAENISIQASYKKTFLILRIFSSYFFPTGLEMLVI